MICILLMVSSSKEGTYHPAGNVVFCYLSVIFHNLIQLIKKYVILTRNKSFRGGSIWEFEVLNIATDLKAINNKKKKD